VELTRVAICKHPQAQAPRRMAKRFIQITEGDQAGYPHTRATHVELDIIQALQLKYPL
jgi:hypothetical protein